MKKVLSLFAIGLFILTASCALSEGAVQTQDNGASVNALTTGVTGANVQLMRAHSFVHYKYGTTYDRAFEIRVKNLAYNKVVGVAVLGLNGSWINYNATYDRSAGAGYEIWKLYINEYNYNTLSNRFAVFYTANGSTYWDNNNGADYFLNLGDGILLGNGLKVLQNGYNASSYINIDLKNLGYTKSVQVVYTTDNWVSSKTTNATYQSRIFYGYATSYSPNAAGFERWTVSIPGVSTNKLQYYIKYSVNGSTYYDNNFDQNYKF